MVYWLNGEFREDAQAVHIADRGLLLGDGVFETVLLKDGVPAFWDAHMARLEGALNALHIPARADAFAPGAVKELAARNGAASGAAVLRLTATRGAGGRGLAPPPGVAPTLLMTVEPYAPPADDPLRLVVGARRRSEQSLSARYKTANYLDNVMARREAAEAGADEAVMLNGKGRVACASAANVFVLSGDGTMTTPPVAEGALPGIVRQVLLERAGEDGFAVREAAIEPSALRGKRIFLTNSLIGVRPARFHGETALRDPGGDGLLSALQAWYKKILDQDVERRAGLF